MIEGMERIVGEHRFFAGLGAEAVRFVAGCTRNVRFEAGQYLFRAGEPADEFFLLRHGRVMLELPVPGKDVIAFQTAGEGDVVGVSWLVPPYRWLHDARAIDLVRAIGVDARCLRRKCDDDHDVGYAMMQRFVPVLVDRLQATRLQMLDVYGTNR